MLVPILSTFRDVQGLKSGNRYSESRHVSRGNLPQSAIHFTVFACVGCICLLLVIFSAGGGGLHKMYTKVREAKHRCGCPLPWGLRAVRFRPLFGCFSAPASKRRLGGFMASPLP